MEIDAINLNITQYLDYCKFQKGLSFQTLKAYQIDLTQFVVFLKGCNRVCNKESLQSYIVYLHDKYKIKSVKRKIAALKAYFSYLEFEELIETNPFNRMQLKLHEPFLLPKIIPLSSIDAILKRAYQQKDLEKHDTYKYRADDVFP